MCIPTKIDDWGEIILEQIIKGDDFWFLLDELCDDKSGFLYNKSIILEAYKEGNLYGLSVTETDNMYFRSARGDKIFCHDKIFKYVSWYLLPCFCVKENNKAIIIWTHTRARKMGFAKKLVELLNIEIA